MESSGYSQKTLQKGSCPYAPLDEVLRYLPRVSHVSPQIPKMAIRGSYEAALRQGDPIAGA